MDTCGNCKWAQANPQNMQNVDCYGVPPSPLALPHPQGVQIQFVRPMMARGERACSLFKTKLLVGFNDDPQPLGENVQSAFPSESISNRPKTADGSK